MARKLKVYRTPIGFHDAYVAAPSQKAALEAWGTDRNLLARGVAEEVDDAELAAEPPANSGKVIKRSRGTTAEQIVALPKDALKLRRSKSGEGEPSRGTTARTEKAAGKPPSKPTPKPSRDELDGVERALAEAEALHVDAERELASREREMRKERDRLEREHRRDTARLQADLDKEGAVYERAIRKWKGRDGREPAAASCRARRALFRHERPPLADV